MSVIVERLIRPLMEIKAKKIREACQGLLYGSVLDVGAGRGLIAKLLRDRDGLPVTAVDINPLREVSVPYALFDGVRLPFRDNEFDTLMLVYVLHHCEDCLPLLRECKRVTRDRLILIEDTRPTPWTGLLDYVGNKILHDVEAPLKFRSEEGWIHLLQSEGFRVLEVRRGVEKEWFYPFVEHTLFAVTKSNAMGASAPDLKSPPTHPR